MERVLAVSGTLAAQEQSTLSVKVPGRLQQVFVDIGSNVRQGDVLAQVEPRDYELRVQQAAAAVSQARADLGLPLDGEDDQVDVEQVSAVRQARAVLEEAARNRDRVVALSREGVASTAERDTVESDHTVAKSRLETAREQGRTRLATLRQRRVELEIAHKQLADTALRAPFDGTVQTRPASLGEYMAAGVPVVTVVRVEPLRLRLEVPERDWAVVHTNQLVRVRVEGLTNAISGRIVRLSPAINDANRMLLVEANVPGGGVLRAGLFARAEILVREGDPGLSVPTSVLMVFAGIEKVVTLKEGKSLERVITTGRQGSGWVEVLSGLSEGELVVLNPAGLRTGQSVTVETAPAKSAR
jgi:RND family efflux transporter MFP subunit